MSDMIKVGTRPMSPIGLVERAADVLRRPVGLRVPTVIDMRLAELLDGIAEFARHPGVIGPQEPVLALCRAILHATVAAPAETRCSVTELVPDQCAHCRKLPDPFVDPGDYGPTFEARWAGQCCVCGDMFDPGDQIRSASGGFVCSGCAP